MQCESYIIKWAAGNCGWIFLVCSLFHSGRGVLWLCHCFCWHHLWWCAGTDGNSG